MEKANSEALVEGIMTYIIFLLPTLLAIHNILLGTVRNEGWLICFGIFYIFGQININLIKGIIKTFKEEKAKYEANERFKEGQL